MKRISPGGTTGLSRATNDVSRARNDQDVFLAQPAGEHASSPIVLPSSGLSVSIRYHKRDVIQQRVALVTQQIQMQQGRVMSIPVEERPIDADGVVVEPAVVRVEVKSIEGAPNRR